MDESMLLVENLLARLVPAPVGHGYVWQGIITQREVDALRKIVGLPSSETHSAPSSIPASTEADVILNTSSMSLPANDEIILCLDFGTAFSKAAAIDENDEIVEIGLGRSAGERELQFPVQSSIYIANDRIWFGPQAIEYSLRDDDPARRRFDSPKQEMSQGDLDQLNNRHVGADINPTAVRFSRGDLIQLFLAYLIALSRRELAEGLGVATLDFRPRLRFARPCWAEDRAKLADRAFSEMLVKGQIIADTLDQSWSAGVPVSIARLVLNKMSEVVADSAQYADRGILEATAAASGALKGNRNQSIFLVVDVGAGTCDFGLFFAVSNRKIAEISGTTQVLRQAGDKIDELLMSALMEQANVGSNSDEATRMLPRLRLVIRDLKERLFRNGSVTHTFENDEVATITLAAFCASPSIQSFTTAVREAARRCLQAPQIGTYKRTDGKVEVILTGGGASLPMVRGIFNEIMQIQNHGAITFVVHTEIPDWLNDYPDLQPIFPQMAVALGGAQRDLPAQAATVTDIVQPTAGPRTIPTEYKS